MGSEGANFAFPVLPNKTWVRVLDTSLPSPDDFADPGQEVSIGGDRYFVNGHSIVVLKSQR